MTARHPSYTIAGLTGRPDLGDALRAAIRSNAHVFLNPPIANLGHRGIGKAARQVPRWLDRSSDPSHDLPLAAALMNAAGPAARCSAPCTATSRPNAPHRRRRQPAPRSSAVRRDRPAVDQGGRPHHGRRHAMQVLAGIRTD
ncbi:DUF4872 domain-containing protein [Micromonospora chersina]|uniref:DUF4872 domain-containing protein n=1 Tax=Micromonospora chersina TaxID=47854 RepID=UPI003CA73CC1